MDKDLEEAILTVDRWLNFEPVVTEILWPAVKKLRDYVVESETEPREHELYSQWRP